MWGGLGPPIQCPGENLEHEPQSHSDDRTVSKPQIERRFTQISERRLIAEICGHLRLPSDVRRCPERRDHDADSADSRRQPSDVGPWSPSAFESVIICGHLRLPSDVRRCPERRDHDADSADSRRQPSDVGPWSPSAFESVIICGHRRPPAGLRISARGSPNSVGPRSPSAFESVIICGHLRSSAGICGRLRPTRNRSHITHSVGSLSQSAADRAGRGWSQSALNPRQSAAAVSVALS